MALRPRPLLYFSAHPFLGLGIEVFPGLVSTSPKTGKNAS